MFGVTAEGELDPVGGWDTRLSAILNITNFQKRRSNSEELAEGYLLCRPEVPHLLVWCVLVRLSGPEGGKKVQQLLLRSVCAMLASMKVLHLGEVEALYICSIDLHNSISGLQ